MKKRILAIFLTASLLVCAMAASSWAMDYVFSAVNAQAGLSASTNLTGSADVVTGSVSVQQFKTFEMTVTLAGVDTSNAKITVTGTSGLDVNVGDATWNNSASTNSWTVKITPQETTNQTLTIVAATKQTPADGSAVLGGKATIDVTVTAASKPSFDVVQTNFDLGALWDTTNKVFYGGTRVTSADFSKDVGANASVKFFTASFDNYTHAKGTKLVGTITPTTSGLNFYAVSKDGAAPNGHDGKLYGFLSGDVAANASGRYTLTVEATDAAGTTKSVYYFNAKPKPTITVTAPNDITWGKSWTFTPSAKDATSWDIVVSADDLTSYLWDDTRITDHAKYVSADVLKKSADIGFTNANGMLSGTWSADLAKNGDFLSLDVKSWTGGTVGTKKIRLVAYNGSGPRAGRTTADYTLKFVGVGPKLDKTASQMTTAFTNAKFMYGTNIPLSSDSKAVAITATAPGKISWDVTGLPDGLVSADEMNGFTSTLKIYGSPDITVKNQKVTIKAYNPFNTTGVTIEPTISVGSDTFYLFVSNDAAVSKDKGAEDLLPSGDKKVGDEFTTINLRALPGPVEWDDKNLPDGVLLVVSTDDPTAATLSGTFLDGRASKTDINYAIKATNSVISKTDTLSQDLMVYETPVFGDAYLFNKKATINTGTTLSFPLTVAGFPNKASWDIAINGTTIIQNSAPVTTPTDYSKGWQPTTYAGDNFNPKTFLSVDLAALSKDETLKFVGSLDAVPTGDGTFTVTVTAKNLAEPNGVTAQYIVAVKGTAPTLKKEDITLSDTAKNKSMKITGGNAPVTMTAYIDSKTAKKVFGIEEDIDLTTANISGIIFSSDLYGNGSFDYSTDRLPEGVNYSSVAYNKLPITVTAVNPDISDKIANAKYTVTIAGTTPSWNVSNDLSEYKPNPAFSTTTENNTTVTKLGTSHALTAEANKPLSADSTYVVFRPRGSGPFDITVKPMTKNGLTAVVDDRGNVTIAGTPTATKKDVVTKFSLTLKNPSTGDTAKSDLAITAKPKPEAAGSISKTLIIGKNLKLAPKAKVSNNGMEWAISTISRDNQAITEEALESTYGIDFDKTKGTLSGTTLAATGTDKPIIVTMYASSDVANSDPITATITILGAKPKLTTKKLTILKDGSDIGQARIDTNLTGETDTNKANVVFTYTFSDALSGINATKAGNSLTFSGSPSAVTKKQTVEYTLDNYGSAGKGKVAFTVVGSKPQVTSTSNAVSLTANSSTTTTLSLGNKDDVGSKVKWKISTKPGNGVSAKVKGDVNGATVTIKAKKNATAGTTTFAVTATDSISKTTSDPYEITVTVTDASSTSEAPLETKDAATEAEAENEIALGEGEVTFGAERTAGSLTAAQRRVIAEQGYVIAAVLPEIEVTADGQYDFEVDLDEEVAAGAELVWFAFSSKPTTDDEIVDFADENNEETKVVPESHVVIVTPWLNAGAKYAPVIAVKADASEADATTAEGVKEAAEEKAE